MRERTEQFLRVTTLALAALVLLWLLRAGCRAGALVGAKIPAVPTLVNDVAVVTNVPVNKGEKAVLEKTNATNVIALAIANTNANGANVVKVLTKISRDPILTNQPSSTNQESSMQTNLVATNKPAKKSKKNLPPELAMMGGMDFGGRPGMPGKAAKLPPEIQARLDKIVDSELFAPVMRPQPMALLGIAGETVFLRTASGQTGLLKAEEPLEGVKLLRIGINRVLVEVDGQKKELTIFDGNGSESLLPNENSK